MENCDYSEIPPTALVWRVSPRKKAGAVFSSSFQLFAEFQRRTTDLAPVLFLATETAVLASSSLDTLNFYFQFDPGLRCWRRVAAEAEEYHGAQRWHTKWGWREFQAHLGLRWITLPQSRLALPLDSGCSGLPSGRGTLPWGYG